MRDRVAKGLEGTPILVLDCNAEFEGDETRCQEMLDDACACCGRLGPTHSRSSAS